jgi:AcrR family transcriptional regulator
MARPVGSRSKDLILESVEKLIAVKGVKDISIHDIAKASGLSQGTIYYHYSVKDDIIFDVIARHVDEMKDEFDDWFYRHQEGISPDRFLEVILSKGVKLYDRAKMHLFLINECLSGNEIIRQRFVEKWDEWRDTLSNGVRKVFPNDEDPNATAYLLMLIIDGLVVQEGIQGNGLPIERLISKVRRIG